MHPMISKRDSSEIAGIDSLQPWAHIISIGCLKTSISMPYHLTQSHQTIIAIEASTRFASEPFYPIIPFGGTLVFLHDCSHQIQQT